MGKLIENLETALKNRESLGLYRSLFKDDNLIDFITNDYLGFSKLIQMSDENEANSPSASRLLGGNNNEIEELENAIAAFHGFHSSLFYTSGYAANLGLFSCLLSRHDTYIYDEQIHASIRDGIRLSMASAFSFKHNDSNDLQEKLKHAKGNSVVVVESVYSMNGDCAPLIEISNICQQYQSNLIVDEAHAIGVFGNEGRGLVHELKLTNNVFAVVYTYGKAMGAHGGAIAGNEIVKKYLINFSRSFIYTTAPSFHQIRAVKTAYSLLASPVYEQQIRLLKKNIAYFADTLKQKLKGNFSSAHINGLKPGSVEKVKKIAEKLRTNGFNVRPVLSPTVTKGNECIRVNLHAYNSLKQINDFVNCYSDLLGNE